MVDHHILGKARFWRRVLRQLRPRLHRILIRCPVREEQRRTSANAQDEYGDDS